MKVLRAKTAGFCMGVSLALKKLDSQIADARQESTIYMLGPIIHNPQVLDEYAQRGVSRADSVEEIPEGARAVIRAHGIPLTSQETLVQAGAKVVDATCPKVKKAQLLIQEQARDGKTLLLYGEENHPEVKGLLSYASAGAYVFDSIEDFIKLGLAREPGRNYFFAAQTTQDKRQFKLIEAHLKKNFDPDLCVFNTICDATRLRQQEAIKIAQEAEYMVVVGGRSSGNTRRLVKVVEKEKTFCLHVETVDELPLEELKKYRVIGLTAGASTPKKIIDDVEQCLENLKK